MDEIINKLQVSNEQIIEEIQKISKYVLTLKTDFMPMTIITGIEFNHGQSEEHRVIIDMENADLNDTDAKFEIFKNIGIKLFEENMAPKLVTMITEAWISLVDKENLEEHQKKYPLPRHDPKKQEVVLVSGLSINAKIAMTYAPIIGRYKNKTPNIGEFNKVECYDGPSSAALLQQTYLGFFGECQKHKFIFN